MGSSGGCGVCPDRFDGGVSRGWWCYIRKKFWRINSECYPNALLPNVGSVYPPILSLHDNRIGFEK